MWLLLLTCALFVGVSGTYYRPIPSTPSTTPEPPTTTTADTDRCASDPCKNGGSCCNTAYGFTCDCTGTGYTGSTCEEDINECKPDNPCKNGGVCTNTIGSFKCNCDGTGFEGQTCEEDRDECAENYRLCWGGGRCINTAGNYTCCPPGYTGDHCNIDIDECGENNPCQNGGSCTNLPGCYFCICPPTYHGRHCENDIDECNYGYSNICHHGTCRNTFGGYHCKCYSGWTGPNCEEETCSPGQFLNVATGICEVCPPGFISTIGSATACTPCPNGTVPNRPRTECVCCPPNTIALSGNPNCTPCSPGQISNEEQTECIDVVDIIETDQSCQDGHSESDKAIDGKFHDLCYCSKINSAENPWWRGKLSGLKLVKTVVIVNRPDCCQEQMCNTDVYVSDKKYEKGDLCGTVKCPAANYDRFEVECETPIKGEYVTLIKNTAGAMKSLVVCEVSVIAGELTGDIASNFTVSDTTTPTLTTLPTTPETPTTTEPPTTIESQTTTTEEVCEYGVKCHEHAHCSRWPGRPPKCKCNNGWEGDGKECKNYGGKGYKGKGDKGKGKGYKGKGDKGKGDKGKGDKGKGKGYKGKGDKGKGDKGKGKEYKGKGEKGKGKGDKGKGKGYKGKGHNEICPAEYVDDNSLDDCNSNRCHPGERCIDKVGGYECQALPTCPPEPTAPTGSPPNPVYQPKSPLWGI